MQRSRVTTCLLVSLCSFASGPLHAETAPPIDLSPLLQSVISAADIPGAAALVIRGDEVIAQGVAGVRKRGSNVAVSLTDRWEIASGSKAMTATVIATLVTEHRLDWDGTLRELWEANGASLHPAWRDVTLAQLLTHTSGARDRRGDFLRLTRGPNADLPAQRRAYIATVLSHPPPTAPGSVFHYCNTNYLIVATLAEQLTGQSIEHLLQSQVFNALQLSTAGFGPPGTSGRIDEPWGHGSRWLRYLPLPFTRNTPFDPGSPQADFPAAANPAGRVHLSLMDWSRFAALHLRGDPHNPHQEARLRLDFATLHQPATGTDYAAGWYVGTRSWARGSRATDTGRILYHAGDNGRWNCVVYLAPEIDLAVLIACNRGGTWKPVDQIAGTLVSRFASPPSHSDTP